MFCGIDNISYNIPRYFPHSDWMPLYDMTCPYNLVVISIRFEFTTCIVPIRACCFLKLHNAITCYSRLQLILTKVK